MQMRDVSSVLFDHGKEKEKRKLTGKAYWCIYQVLMEMVAFIGKTFQKEQQNPQVTKRVWWERKHLGKIMWHNDSVMVACDS